MASYVPKGMKTQPSWTDLNLNNTLASGYSSLWNSNSQKAAAAAAAAALSVHAQSSGASNVAQRAWDCGAEAPEEYGLRYIQYNSGSITFLFFPNKNGGKNIDLVCSNTPTRALFFLSG